MSAVVVIGQTSWHSVIEGTRTTHFPCHALKENGLPRSSISVTGGSGRGRCNSVPIAKGAGTAPALADCLTPTRASTESATTRPNTTTVPAIDNVRRRRCDTGTEVIGRDIAFQRG